MLPMGTHTRTCIVCGYPIHAISEALTVHELLCLGVPIDGLPDDTATTHPIAKLVISR